jgi:hypothetical protein
MAEEMFRTPLTRFGGPAEKAAYEALLKRRLVEKIEQMSFPQFIIETEKTGEPDGSHANPE